LSGMGLTLAVCTNKSESISRMALAQLNADDSFVTIVGGDSGFGRKPDPEPLAEVCRRLDVDARNVLMVGDTVMDVGAAHAVGARVAAVRYGYSQVPVESLNADFVIDAFADILALVTRS